VSAIPVTDQGPTRLVTTCEQYCDDAITDRTLPRLDDAS